MNYYTNRHAQQGIISLILEHLATLYMIPSEKKRLHETLNEIAEKVNWQLLRQYLHIMSSPMALHRLSCHNQANKEKGIDGGMEMENNLFNYDPPGIRRQSCGVDGHRDPPLDGSTS